ncbi:MAG TPA: hypothetical protein VHK25_12200, partial [Acidimicrobiales bacterium]|nr:hypothetical protein [Acidimicrobiales bacterium]
MRHALRAGVLAGIVVAGTALATVAALVVTGPIAAAQAPEEGDSEPPGRVLIVSMPRLVWQDVADLAPPNLVSLLERSAVASLSVRAIGPRTDLGEGYVTLGAGNRARVQRGRAGDAVDADEVIGPNTGAELYRAVTGEDPGSASVLSLAVGEAVADADRLLYGSEPGAMGQAISDAGLSAAVIANADGGPPLGADERHREAALAMMDEAGRVAGGTVGAQLGVVDLAAPEGRRMDPEAVLTAFDEAWDGGASAVLVEMSDLERADRNRLPATGPARAAGLAAPLADADELLGELLERVDFSRDRVLVVSPAAPENLGRLTTFALAGRGIEPGLARSATTRRDGFVTLPDVGATVVDSLGLDLPDSMNSTPITSAGGSPFELEDAARLADVDEISRFRDRTVGPVSVVYIVLQVLTYGLAALALSRRSRRLVQLVGGAALLILATPPVAFLSGLGRYDRLGLVPYVVAVFVAAAIVAALARLARRSHPFLPALALVGVNWLLQIVDVALGSRLQLNTPFGYSPIVAGRFQGFGNLAFAILAASAIVVATGPLGLRQRVWPVDAAVGYVTPRSYLGWAAGILALTFLVDGLPSMGADVGGVLATVPAFALVLVLLAGWRVSVAKAVIVCAVTVAALAALALLDLSRPESSRTHLGRFAQRVVDGDAGIVLERKLRSNVSILTSSVWTWLVPACLAFLAFLALRRTGYLHRLQRRVPGVRACLLG